MTRQDQNQSYDQKKGSADLRAVVDDVEKRDGPGGAIPEPPGCGPNVTDYPGLGAPRGEDAQSSGSDA